MTPRSSRLADAAQPLLASLAEARQRSEPGTPRAERQPVHTVYGGAQLFRANIAERLGARARQALDRYAPDPFTFAKALGLRGADAIPDKKKAAKAYLATYDKKPEAARTESRDLHRLCVVYERVRRKLEDEPVEDYRIDFEDGFGVRPDEEEDAVAVVAAMEVAKGLDSGSLPPFLGIRIKPLSGDLASRSVRTLDLFFLRLLEKTAGRLPPDFAVTLPKVTLPQEVEILAQLLGQLEETADLPVGSLRVELLIESPRAIFDREGRFNLPRLLDAASGRVRGVHFGPWDYAAACGIAAPSQRMDHPASDLALFLLQLAYAERGVFLADGPSTVLPLPLHRVEDPADLSKKQLKENREVVQAAWADCYRDIQRSLDHGFFQGWDLHPAQIPVRYAASYEYFLLGLDDVAERLRHFLGKAARAVATGNRFDDAATGRGLLAFFARGYRAGALQDEDLALGDLRPEDLEEPSLEAVLARRAP
ncbi:MAG: phosphoenolpyruvate kinase [Sandaracinaceae bacterium]